MYTRDVRDTAMLFLYQRRSAHVLRASYALLDFMFNIGHRNPASFASGTIEIKLSREKKRFSILDNFVLPLIGKIIHVECIKHN